MGLYLNNINPKLDFLPNLPSYELPTGLTGVNLNNIPLSYSSETTDNSGGFKDWTKSYLQKWGANRYNYLNAGISGGADIASAIINRNQLSTTGGNILSGIGNIVGNIPGPIGWAGKGLALAGSAINALWGHKFNEANLMATQNAINNRNNFLFGDNSTTAALLSGSLNNIGYLNVSTSFLGKEGPFSNAVSNKAKELNNAGMMANLRANNSELNAYSNYLNNMVRNAISGDSMGNVNAAAYGGLFNTFAKGGHTHGALFNNGLIEVNNGGSHELNPNQGVLYGIDPQGTPNMVELGETILDDYVFSKRIKFPKKYKDEFSLGGKIWKKSFADVSKMIAKESEERPNDPISQRSLKAMGGKLADILEEVKARQALNQMDPREVMAMLLQLAMMLLGGEQLMMEDPYQQMITQLLPMVAACGGKLHGYGGNLFPIGGYINPFLRYFLPTLEPIGVAGEPEPYGHAGDANGKKSNTKYVPIRGISSWADFKDADGNLLYDEKTGKYASEYLDPDFLAWAYDNPDNEYLLNADNFVNWRTDNPKKMYPTADEIFGSRGAASGKGFDKKLSDLHIYVQHLYNKYRAGIKDGSIQRGYSLMPSKSNVINEDPRAIKAKQELADKAEAKKRAGYKEAGIKYYIDEVDANGTPRRREIQYDPDTFAKDFPGYRYSKEDEKLYDDDKQTYTRLFVYTKGSEPLNYHELPTWPRMITPLALAVTAGLGLAKLINNADYSFARAFNKAASSQNGYIPTRFQPINNPYEYSPTSNNYFLSDADNYNLGLLRQSQNNFGNNIGLLTANNANILANYNKARSEALRNIFDADLNRRKEYGTLRSGIDLANSTGSLDSQKANQVAFSNWIKLNLDVSGKGLEYAYRAKQDSDEANSTNMSGFLESVSDIGNENMNWNWRNWAIANGVFGPMKQAPYGYGLT